MVLTFEIIQGEKDDKIIAVCADDPEYKHFTSYRELASIANDLYYLSPLGEYRLWTIFNF